ncbi:MAG: hypothetical protein R3Y57_00510 [Erysipelotrichaceae bacterium]
MIKRNYAPYRVALSIIIFFGGVYSIPYLNTYAQSLMITQSFVYSFISFVILFLNYNLFSLHFARFVEQKDKLLFCFVGFLAFMIVYAINAFFLKLPFISIEQTSLQRYALFIPFIVLTLSYFYTISYILVYKLLTDRLNINNAEVKVIFVSSVIFSAILSIVSGFNMQVFDLNLCLSYFALYMMVTLVVSYLYNQTGNLFVSIISMGTCIFICNCITWLI